MKIDIVSPYFSQWALHKLTERKREKVRFITRLPNQYHSAPLFLDNDPRPLKRAMELLGPALSVFALPEVHAKLYITATQSWLGSANFTHNGFSGKGELLIRIAPSGTLLPETFQSFLRKSTKVTSGNIDFLIRCMGAKLTRINPLPKTEDQSGDTSFSYAISYENFQHWLNSQDDSGYISDRIMNKNHVSGHVYSGFHGVSSFILKYPDVGIQLLNVNDAIDDEITRKLTAFVKKYGDQFGGPRGGTWNSKLSTRLGGLQTGGGAGDVIVKHLLHGVAKYLRYKGLI